MLLEIHVRPGLQRARKCLIAQHHKIQLSQERVTETRDTARADRFTINVINVLIRRDFRAELKETENGVVAPIDGCRGAMDAERSQADAVIAEWPSRTHEPRRCRGSLFTRRIEMEYRKVRSVLPEPRAFTSAAAIASIRRHELPARGKEDHETIPTPERGEGHIARSRPGRAVLAERRDALSRRANGIDSGIRRNALAGAGDFHPADCGTSLWDRECACCRRRLPITQ